MKKKEVISVKPLKNNNELKEKILKYGGYFICWLVLWYGFSRWEVGTLFLIGSMFFFIWFTLGERSSGLSAYSVFNKGQKKLLGDKDMNQWENEIRGIDRRGGGGGGNHDYENESSSENDSRQQRRRPVLNRKGKKNETNRLKRNDPCVCGSGLKYKKCCGEVLDRESGSEEDSI
eukprot:c20066_g3_i1.p1 GENE.c20066_g3_i1~~c20066_g3_i1.p1  ORF type:complete len:175 (-),score=63.56 c20066_g3_i1:2-526(-)